MKSALIGAAVGSTVTGAVGVWLLLRVSKHHTIYVEALREANQCILVDAFKYLTEEQMEAVMTAAEFRAIAVSTDPTTTFDPTTTTVQEL